MHDRRLTGTVFVCSIIAAFVAAGFGLHAQDASSRVRDAFLKMLDRPRVPPEPVVRTRSEGPLIIDDVTFAADSGPRVPTVIVKRQGATSRRPVVIVLHGTGGSKAGMMSRLRTLAERGFVAVAIDARYHGERAGSATSGMPSYQFAILNAYKNGGERPFLYDTVWDVMRLVDYLQTRPDVDPARIGLTGISKGGMETYLTAAVDPRIAAAVPLIGVQSFGWALDHSAWDSRAWTLREAITAAAARGESIDAAFMRRFYDRIAPGLRNDFDAPAMLPLIAPRPLLVINGDSDPRTPVAGVRVAMAAATKAYAAHGAADRLELHLQPDTGHQVTSNADRLAVEWFARWLEPGR